MTLLPRNPRARMALLAVGGLALALGAITVARAQGSAVSAAITAGQVGEQSDGYLGIKGTVSASLRAEVDSINIKRRAGYTQIAEQRGVTVQDVAASVGCETLAKRVGPGQSYRMPDGSWMVRDGDNPITLPSYCH